MKGSQKVIDALNDVLAHELAAVDQYIVQGHMLADWGYTVLHERIAHESDDERGHVAQLIARILFLEGTPNVAARTALAIGDDPQQMFKNDLEYELAVAQSLNEAIALCRAEGDNGTRQVLEGLLRDTEDDHILWLRSQLGLMDTLGLENYLSQKL